MQKKIFIALSAFTFMLYAHSTSAGLFDAVKEKAKNALSNDPVCTIGCNAKTCGIKEVQGFCQNKCKTDSIKNCLEKNPEPKPAAEASKDAKGAFCAVSGKLPQLKPVSDKVCG